MGFTISKETSQYLEAIQLLDKATEKVADTLDKIYNPSSGETLSEPYMEAIRKAKSEVYRLIETNIDNNLGMRSTNI